MNEREALLRAALIELESSDDGGEAPDPIKDLPLAVQNAMTEEEKKKRREEASASKDEGDEEVIKRAETLTEILKEYVEGKFADLSNDTF